MEDEEVGPIGIAGSLTQADMRSVPQGLRGVLYTVLGAVILNLCGWAWYASGLEQRMRMVESNEISVANRIGALDQAREQTTLHMSKVDDQLASMDDKLSSMLDIIQRWDMNSRGRDPQEGRGVETKPSTPNFTPSPRH